MHGANFRATEQSQWLRYKLIYKSSPFVYPAFQLWLVALLAQSSILQREKSDPVSPKTVKIISVSCTGSLPSEHEGEAARPETAFPMHCFLIGDDARVPVVAQNSTSRNDGVRSAHVGLSGPKS